MTTDNNHQSTLKVVTITLNPALDLTGDLDALNIGSVNLVKQADFHAAGKGVNVAKVLSDLGAEVTVTGFLGSDNQALFCNLFSDMGATDRFIRVNGSTRINVKLVEENGDVSDINFPGVFVDQAAIDAFELTLFELTKSHDYFVLAGSLPKGISPQLCASWIERLGYLGKKVLFDSSRDALTAGISAKPWLIKPNDEELAHFLGKACSTIEETQQAAQQLHEGGINNIAVSMGAEGVLWLSDLNQDPVHKTEDTISYQWLKSTPPKMRVVSTVGAGDTLVAGLCWGHMQQWDRPDILSFATALSALAVSQVGVGVSSLDDVVQIKQQISLSQL